MTRRFRSGAGWLAGAIAVALLVLLPVAALVLEALRGDGMLWPHLLQYVLPPALHDTLLLLAGVGVMVIALGTCSAWLVTAYDFPGRRIFEWALLLPLAVPTYIMAYAWMDLLHPIGPVQTLSELRDAVNKGLDAVKSGKPFFIDARVKPGYANIIVSRHG